MGNNPSYDLSKHSDVCQIAPLVKSMRGKDVPHARSSSDKWILTLKDDVYYGDEPIAQVFLKVSVNWNYVIKNTPPPVDRLMNWFALCMEMSLYRDVIRHLVDRQVTPHFVRYLGASDQCTFDQLKSILRQQWKDEEEVNARLLSSTLAMYKKTPTSAIHSEPTRVERKFVPMAAEFRYQALALEYVGEQTMHDWISGVDEYGGNFANDIWILLFQVATACYAMSLSHMVHNDLHLNNIMVEEAEYPTPTRYIIEDDVYDISSSLTAKVFDFDRSYSEQTVPNVFVNAKTECMKTGTCNRIMENYDIICLLLAVNKRTRYRNINAEILDIITNKPELKRKLPEMSSDSITPDILEGCRSMLDILKRIHAHCVSTSTNRRLNSTNGHLKVYACSRGMFGPWGHLLPERDQAREREKERESERKERDQAREKDREKERQKEREKERGRERGREISKRARNESGVGRDERDGGKGRRGDKERGSDREGERERGSTSRIERWGDRGVEGGSDREGERGSKRTRVGHSDYPERENKKHQRNYEEDGKRGYNVSVRRNNARNSREVENRDSSDHLEREDEEREENERRERDRKAKIAWERDNVRQRTKGHISLSQLLAENRKIAE